MGSAVIVDVARTATGKRNGLLSGWHPADLAGEVIKTLVERNDLDPGLVEDVIMGCVTQVGAQAFNVGRSAVLAAGLPDTVPATTIDRQCGSSQQAAHFAAQGVMAGAYDVVIAGGVEVMSRVPMGASGGFDFSDPTLSNSMEYHDSVDLPFGAPFGPGVDQRYRSEGGLVAQGISAELIADQWGLSREDLDVFAARSQSFAARATEEGRFDREIVPLVGRVRDPATGVIVEEIELLRRDQGIRPGTTVETLGALKPAFKPDGKLTAGNSSQIADGASACLIMSEEKAGQLGLVPRARFCSFAVVGVDPILMLTGPIHSTRRALERAKLTIDDLDLVEINEAFAPVVLAWAKELHPDMEKVNVNGGAIALGHPLGCSGTKLLATLVNELERTAGRYGLVTMCEGGGMANATVIERLG